MSNYYQVQRGTASLENHRMFTSGSKCVAVIPFYLPKLGGINAWEFTGTEEVTDQETNEKVEQGKMPTGFKGYLFSCAQAAIDYIRTNFNKQLSTDLLTYKNRGNVFHYEPPENYTHNPADYVIIGGSSQRDSENDAMIPNHITISYSHGDRPYYNEDGERFWAHEDRAVYFSVIVFDTNPGLKKLVSTLYYT